MFQLRKDKLTFNQQNMKLTFFVSFVLFHVIKEMVHGVVDALGKLSEVDDNGML